MILRVRLLSIKKFVEKQRLFGTKWFFFCSRDDENYSLPFALSYSNSKVSWKVQKLTEIFS